jgi:hypothetical protein
MTACHRCSKPTDNARGVCDECLGERSPQTHWRYNDADWKKRQRAFLARHPWCVLCLRQGKSVEATVVDHWPDSRRELLARGVTDPDTDDRLRPLCASHHAKRGASHTMRFNNDPA